MRLAGPVRCPRRSIGGRHPRGLRSLGQVSAALLSLTGPQSSLRAQRRPLATWPDQIETLRASGDSAGHPAQSPPLQAGSCQLCRSMKGEGDRGLGEIGESECYGRPSLGPHTARPAQA
eukprot:scaffold1072_cov118-Isochrysis_galbana.AAC.9